MIITLCNQRESILRLGRTSPHLYLCLHEDTYIRNYLNLTTMNGRKLRIRDRLDDPFIYLSPQSRSKGKTPEIYPPILHPAYLFHCQFLASSHPRDLDLAVKGSCSDKDQWPILNSEYSCCRLGAIVENAGLGIFIQVTPWENPR